MDINIERLRNVFSYANVITDSSGIVINYAKKGEWITQCIENSDLSFLKKILTTSPSVSFQCVKGKSVNIFILADLPEFENRTAYMALKSPQKIDINELISTLPIPLDVHRISHAIRTSSDEVVDNLIKEIIQRNRSKAPKYTHRGRYNAILTKIQAIANKTGISYVEFPIEPGFSGSVELRLPEDTERVFEFTGDLKNHFDELVEISTEIDFECNVEAGYLNISFYA